MKKRELSWGISGGTAAGYFGPGGKAGAEAAPEVEGQDAEGDNAKLKGHKSNQPFEGGIHETIGVEADAEHIYSEPGETRYDISEDREVHEPPFANKSTPASMKDQRIPDHDQQRAVLLGVPSP